MTALLTLEIALPSRTEALLVAIKHRILRPAARRSGARRILAGAVAGRAEVAAELLRAHLRSFVERPVPAALG
ncbi:MAG: hypothetical protein ACREQM_09485 [Candidatus Dormibacteraceae bacterium]